MQDTVALGAYTESLHSTSLEQRQLEWWEPRLFLLPLLIFLCVAGQFVAPMVPDLYPAVAISHLLALSFSWYVYWRVAKIMPRPRTSASNYPDRSAPTQNAIPAPRRQRYSIYGLISLPSIAFFQSTIYVLFQSLYILKDLTLAHALCALVASIPFALIWPSRVAAYERLTAQGKNYALLVVGTLLVYFAIYAATIFGMPQLLKGSPAPWPTLLAFAQREAEKTDEDAVLTRVMTYNNNSLFASSDSAQPLRAIFYFDAGGSEIEVDVMDSNPPRLLVKRHSGAFAEPVEPARAELINRRLASITFGPRDLYIQTEAEARRYGMEHQADPSALYVTASLYPGTDFRDLRGAETVWNISYVHKTPEGLRSLYFYVDASTGKILQREEH